MNRRNRLSPALPILCLALAGFSNAAQADESSHYQIPGLSANGPPFTFDLEAPNRLTITNNLTTGFSPNRVVVAIPGMTVGVGIVHGKARMGDEPDLITVDPPEGMVAIPNEFLMEEGETVVVHIVPQEMM
jgi:hypothetical protein